MWTFFFFRNALCSAARIFFSSSEPEATSSERYSSTAVQPASDLSAILISLFLRFKAFEAALRESSSLRINAETWWSLEFKVDQRVQRIDKRHWVTCSKVSVLNSNCFLLPLNLKLKFVWVLSFFTKDEDGLSWSSKSSRFKCDNVWSK